MVAMSMEIVNELLHAAQDREWDRVDQELIPQLRDVDGNRAAEILLERTKDLNPDIRDVVASALTPLQITDREIYEKAIGEMVEMAVNDKEKFPAGRAAMFLWSHRNDEIFGDKIQDGINKFRNREEIAKWKNELVKNIPGINELFGTAQ